MEPMDPSPRPTVARAYHVGGSQSEDGDIIHIYIYR